MFYFVFVFKFFYEISTSLLLRFLLLYYLVMFYYIFNDINIIEKIKNIFKSKEEERY